MKIFKLLCAVSLFILVIILIGCSTEPENIATSADGVQIRFDIQGEGVPALVFIHGWCCDRSYWDAQVPYFAQKYKVVTIDLAGHGESGLDRNVYTMGAFGEDVVAVVNKLGLDQVVLIGHSMGGPVILEAACLMPNRVVGLVGADTFRNIERRRTQTELNEIFTRFSKNFTEAASDAMRSSFASTADLSLVEKVVSDVSKFSPEIGCAEQKAYFNYIYNKLTQALQEIHAPIRCINRDNPETNVKAVQKYVPTFKVVTISNVGHFVMIEDPETFNRLLEETIEEFTQSTDLK